MGSKGKAYSNRLKKEKRPTGDFYATPNSLINCNISNIQKHFSKKDIILEPCCGQFSISNKLSKHGYIVHSHDLYTYDAIDYLKTDFNEQFIITNPPFSLFDEFVIKAKTHCKKFMFIGRLNYLGTHGRNVNGLWKNLRAIYCFDRYVDYRTKPRKDGLFHVGAMATGWFLWDMEFNGPPNLHILNIQKWAKLGMFK